MPKMTQRVTLLAAACLALSAGLAGAEPGPLDGRKFEGVFIERGKTSGDADTITFKDGRFRSSACDRYGYSDANTTMKVAYGTEGGLFSERLGIQTVICGPGSMAQGHRPDEFITLEQFDACRSMLEGLLGRIG